MARQTIQQVKGSFETEQLQRNTEAFVYRVVPSWVTDGVLLENVAVINGAVEINHKLNRVPLGFLVLDIDAFTAVWSTARTSSTITLNAANTATIKLWVF